MENFKFFRFLNLREKTFGLQRNFSSNLVVTKKNKKEKTSAQKSVEIFLLHEVDRNKFPKSSQIILFLTSQQKSPNFCLRADRLSTFFEKIFLIFEQKPQRNSHESNVREPNTGTSQNAGQNLASFHIFKSEKIFCVILTLFGAKILFLTLECEGLNS